MNSILELLARGLMPVSVLTMIILFLITTQLTIFSVTLYLHRCQAHRAVDLHPVLCHLFRFWAWFSTGQITREWVAIHRKHHARCETDADPHSPAIFGIRKVLLDGVGLYRTARGDNESVEKYGHGCPDDWIERHLYARFPALGPTSFAIIAIVLFGSWGVTYWAISMIWIPFFAAGVINGLGHYFGYRNQETPDQSHNLVPWGVWLGGEELHNNHHAFPSSARFSLRKWEFDLGWAMIRLFSAVGLAKVLRVAPKLTVDPDKSKVDIETLKTLFANRYEVLTHYCRQVIVPTVRQESGRVGKSMGRVRGRVHARWSQLMSRDSAMLDLNAKEHLSKVLSSSEMLATVHRFRQRLNKLWDRTSTNPEALLKALQEWIRDAEASGIKTLAEFAQNLRRYRMIAVGA